MEIALQIILGIVALICLLGGTNILLKGAMHFLPKETPTQLVLDDLVRFLAGIYFGFSFLLAYAVFNMRDLGNAIYFLGIIVFFSGFGRLYSRIKVGTAGKYFDFVMTFEMILGITIVILQYFK